jgi:hypothetical protein
VGWFGSNIVVQCTVGPIITFYGLITVRKCLGRLSNQVDPMLLQTLFLNNDEVFQEDNNAPNNTAGTVQSWFEDHEGELQHFPWPAQSPDFNIIAPLWSVWRLYLGTDSNLQHLISNLKILFEKMVQSSVQNLYWSIPRRNAAILKAKYGSAPYY